MKKKQLAQWAIVSLSATALGLMAIQPANNKADFGSAITSQVVAHAATAISWSQFTGDMQNAETGAADAGDYMSSVCDSTYFSEMPDDATGAYTGNNSSASFQDYFSQWNYSFNNEDDQGNPTKSMFTKDWNAFVPVYNHFVSYLSGYDLTYVQNKYQKVGNEKDWQDQASAAADLATALEDKLGNLWQNAKVSKDSSNNNSNDNSNNNSNNNGTDSNNNNGSNTNNGGSTDNNGTDTNNGGSGDNNSGTDTNNGSGTDNGGNTTPTNPSNKRKAKANTLYTIKNSKKHKHQDIVMYIPKNKIKYVVGHAYKQVKWWAKGDTTHIVDGESAFRALFAKYNSSKANDASKDKSDGLAQAGNRVADANGGMPKTSRKEYKYELNFLKKAYSYKNKRDIVIKGYMDKHNRDHFTLGKWDGYITNNNVALRYHPFAGI